MYAIRRVSSTVAMPFSVTMTGRPVAALAYRIVDLASLRAFSFNQPADFVTAIPGLWLAVIGLAMLTRAAYEMLQEPQLR